MFSEKLPWRQGCFFRPRHVGGDFFFWKLPTPLEIYRCISKSTYSAQLLCTLLEQELCYLQQIILNRLGPGIPNNHKWITIMIHLAFLILNLFHSHHITLLFVVLDLSILSKGVIIYLTGSKYVSVALGINAIFLMNVMNVKMYENVKNNILLCNISCMV